VQREKHIQRPLLVLASNRLSMGASRPADGLTEPDTVFGHAPMAPPSLAHIVSAFGW